MRTGGRVLTLLAVLVSLAGCGGHPALRQPPLPEPVIAPPATTTPSSVPPCATGLRFVTDQSEAAMGLRLMRVKAVNCGAEPVQLTGYPVVRLMDERYQPLAVEILRGSGGISDVPGFDAPPQPVTLQPGQTALSRFMWKNTQATLDPPVVGRHVDVQVGAVWQALIPKWSELVAEPKGEPQITIDLGSTGRLGVEAWRPAD